MQSVHITTYVVSSNSTPVDVYSIQHYAVKTAHIDWSFCCVHWHRKSVLYIPSKSRDLADKNNKILTEWKWFETTVGKKERKQLVENRHYHYKDHRVIDESWSKVVTKSSFFFTLICHWRKIQRTCSIPICETEIMTLNFDELTICPPSKNICSLIK